ncbi:MAG TPA: S1C family serine protease [Caulobacteraceae bacterium]|nr:S1C family serine protease [Caulobacteraceae bacterium]
MRLRTPAIVLALLLLCGAAVAVGWSAGARRDDFETVARRATPAVVALYSDFGSARRDQPVGAGFVTREGFVIASARAIETAPYLEARLASGQRVRATVLGRDDGSDLAALRLETDAPPKALEWGSTTRPGRSVLVVGAGRGMSPPLVSAVVASGARRVNDSRIGLVQIDRPLGRGHWGAPVLDPQGEVIAVVVARPSEVAFAEGSAFALSAAAARPIVARLIDEASDGR